MANFVSRATARWLGILLGGLALGACTVDRAPLQSEALTEDASDGQVWHWQDTSVPAEDAGDAGDAIEAGTDARVELDAGADGSSADAGQDAAVDATVDSGPPPPVRYTGPCKTDHDCAIDEVCVRNAGLTETLSYCAQACNADDECSVGPSTAGAPRCSNNLCRLPCDALLGTGCPRSMVCRDLLIILPVDDGTCSFQE